MNDFIIGKFKPNLTFISIVDKINMQKRLNIRKNINAINSNDLIKISNVILIG